METSTLPADLLQTRSCASTAVEVHKKKAAMAAIPSASVRPIMPIPRRIKCPERNHIQLDRASPAPGKATPGKARNMQKELCKWNYAKGMVKRMKPFRRSARWALIAASPKWKEPAVSTNLSEDLRAGAL